MAKTFVLRSNALLSSDHSTQKFGSDNIIVIPMAVLDEIIYNRKNLSIEKQRIRKSIMDYISSFDHDKLFSAEGVRQENGSILRVVKNFKEQIIPEDEELTKYQRRTLQVCIGLKSEGHNVILVTNNPCLQMRAQDLKIKAECFRDETFPHLEEQYQGRQKIPVSVDVMNEFYRNGSIAIEKLLEFVDEANFTMNEFIILETPGSRVMGKVSENLLVEVDYHRTKGPYGVTPMNDGQKILFNALYGDEPLVTVTGGAGTGKTYITLAVALELLEKGEYERILVTRKTDYSAMGYLPGDVDEKMAPYLAGFKDNLKILLNSDRKKQSKKESFGRKGKSIRPEDCEDTPYEDGTYYFETGKIKIQSIDMLRGRSICNTIFIIDEAQNIEPEFIKTIVTRAGSGSKFIFLGDPTQIDNPALNERYNGLTYLTEKMKGSEFCVHVTLYDSESVRSDLARAAASIL